MNEEELSLAVTDLALQNPGQCSADEYMAVARAVVSCGSGNVLVFGSGKDTELWAKVAAGHICVLESDAEWIKVAYGVAARFPNLSVIKVGYAGTKVSRFRDEIKRGVDGLALRDIDQVNNRHWGVVFVDAPNGASPRAPGRLRSIATAAYLSSRGIADHIFVHDCNRELEAQACDAMLSHLELVAEIGKLRHYARRSDEATLGGSF